MYAMHVTVTDNRIQLPRSIRILFVFVYYSIVIFRVSRIDHEKCIVVTRVCVSVRGRMPTLLHGPGCNLGDWWGMPPSCALLGGFAIGARVVLLWQHYGNQWQSPAVISHAHRTPHACSTRTLRMPAKTPLAGDNIDAPAACAVPFRPYCRGCNANAKC